MWVKLDDCFHQNKKTTYIGAVAADLYVAGLEYCNTHLTDGFIPAVEVPKLCNYQRVSRLPGWLVAVLRLLLRERLEDLIGRLTTSVDGHRRPLWQRTEREGVPGYLVHDFHGYQPTRKSVLNARARAKKSYETRRAEAKGTCANSGAEVAQIKSTCAFEGAGTPQTQKVYAQTSAGTDSYKDERARVPGTYDPEKNDPDTIPDLRTSNVVLLSQQQATSTQELPTRKKRAPGDPPSDPVENQNAETSTPAFLRPSPDFEPAVVRGVSAGARGQPLVDGGCEGGDQTAHCQPGLHVSAFGPARARARPGGGGARAQTPAASTAHSGATEFTPGRSAMEGNTLPADGTVRVDSGTGGRTTQRPAVWENLKQRFAGYRERN